MMKVDVAAVVFWTLAIAFGVCSWVLLLHSIYEVFAR